MIHREWKTATLVVVAALVAGGCAIQRPAPVPAAIAATAPPPPTEEVMVEYVKGEKRFVRDVLTDPVEQAVGSWHAFAKPEFNGRINGSAPSIDELAADFGKSASRYFRNEAARQIVVDVGHAVRPDLVTSREAVSGLLESVSKNPVDTRMIPCKEAVAGRKLRAAAIDDRNQITWTERECDPDEYVVQIRALDDSWVDWFSIKCLNPLDGSWHEVERVETVVSSSPPESCPVWHPFPAGPAEKWGQGTFLFLTPEEQRCIPKEWTCPNQECLDWMKGLRGDVPETVYRKWKDHGGAAFKVAEGVSGVWMPAGDHIDPWYCDRRENHQWWEAFPLPPEGQDS